jgi:hypothetical protein
MDKKQVRSFFDFIDVDLYLNPEWYTVKNEPYFIWSELKQEFQRHEMTEAFTWDYIEPFVKTGQVYVER